MFEVLVIFSFWLKVGAGAGIISESHSGTDFLIAGDISMHIPFASYQEKIQMGKRKIFYRATVRKKLILYLENRAFFVPSRTMVVNQTLLKRSDFFTAHFFSVAYSQQSNDIYFSVGGGGFFRGDFSVKEWQAGPVFMLRFGVPTSPDFSSFLALALHLGFNFIQATPFPSRSFGFFTISPGAVMHLGGKWFFSFSIPVDLIFRKKLGGIFYFLPSIIYAS